MALHIGVEVHGIQAGEAAAQGADGGLEDIFSRMRGDLDSEESEEELKGILETMMSQLMSKDVPITFLQGLSLVSRREAARSDICPS